MEVRLKEVYPQPEAAVIVLEEESEAMLLYTIILEAKDQFSHGTNEHEMCELLLDGLEN